MASLKDSMNLARAASSPLSAYLRASAKARHSVSKWSSVRSLAYGKNQAFRLFRVGIPSKESGTGSVTPRNSANPPAILLRFSSVIPRVEQANSGEWTYVLKGTGSAVRKVILQGNGPT